MRQLGPMSRPIGNMLKDLAVITIQLLLVCAFLAIAVFAGMVVVWG